MKKIEDSMEYIKQLESAIIDIQNYILYEGGWSEDGDMSDEREKEILQLISNIRDKMAKTG